MYSVEYSTVIMMGYGTANLVNRDLSTANDNVDRLYNKKLK